MQHVVTRARKLDRITARRYTRDLNRWLSVSQRIRFKIAIFAVAIGVPAWLTTACGSVTSAVAWHGVYTLQPAVQPVA